MRIYDVSVPITGQMPVYPGDPEVEINQWSSLAQGDPANVTALKFGAHTGTHVDAPAHFIAGGGRVEALDLETLIGDVQVIEIPDEVIEINDSHVEDFVPPGASRVLFKTRNSAFWNEPMGQFHTDYTYLSPAAALSLVERNIRLVGIDYLSVERFQPVNYATHEALLSAGVIIVEGLDLREVSAGLYELICLPIKIGGGSGDGAPARVVLRGLT